MANDKILYQIELASQIVDIYSEKDYTLSTTIDKVLYHLKGYITDHEMNLISSSLSYEILEQRLDKLFDTYDDSEMFAIEKDNTNHRIRNQMTPILTFFNLIQSYKHDKSELALKLALSDDTENAVKLAIENLLKIGE